MNKRVFGGVPFMWSFYTEEQKQRYIEESKYTNKLFERLLNSPLSKRLGLFYIEHDWLTVKFHQIRYRKLGRFK